MKSYLSPKTEIKQSNIEGKGLFAAKLIRKGEIIGIKGGYIFDRKKLNKIKESMMFLNHSCEPNAGIEGNIVFIAMRDIKAGEEITIDYAMCDDDNFELKCNCQSKSCRKIITGKDWMKKELQKRYAGYFSIYLEKKIKLFNKTT